ncbi:ATP-binding cassette subfamily B protein [Actinocorallia herbida]|uniref:ATP-binding cassette subfamily B protein n=1 Tax=Actinocorallia herbida TaxID=58109 RepID=A0A3N1CSC6_9ACTN|nr:ABC transporter ATP-binding protein [Actinocorallia herbida]ROO84197.1 ATP-binding cassette subfamily B protein [Actinocorallia herbida]
MGMPGNGFATMSSYRRDPSVKHARLKPGTVRRIVSYARPYKRDMAWFLGLNALSATIVVAGPLMIQRIIDKGVVPGNLTVVVWLSVGLAVLALVDAVLSLGQRWFSARVGEGLIYDLRTQVFDHVQRMPVAFFVRAQTGALVSRLNNDVIGAQRALTTTLSSVVSNVISLVLVLVAMLYLSWPITLISLLLLPVFIIPAKLVGRRLQRISREQMVLDAEMGSLMTERFNVAGAMLAKLYGRPADESEGFSGRAGRVRDVGVAAAMYGRVIFTALTLVSALATAAIYGVGGALTVSGAMQIGTLVALAALLNRMYGPLTALSNVQVDVMTALVSFDRVFEVLDLEPMVRERPGARPLAAPKEGEPAAPRVEFDHVVFRYPSAEEVSLASLESIARSDTAPSREVLHDVSFTAEPGQMIALVGHSGAGKSTMTQLASRLYDVTEGEVRIGGTDVRDLTLASLSDTVGVVTQEAHLFHATIGDNLRYARPDATDAELWAALGDAQIRELVEDMPDGLDTVVGDRGHRLSGGEKQRMAIARLLLKAPAVVVLDEATAHLDSESEAAVQKALATALAGRTSLVIAHRLSTIREADEILVVSDGRIAERGGHDELLAANGLYAELYRTQFARQEDQDSTPLG